MFVSKDYLRNNMHISSASEFFERIQSQEWDENWHWWVKAFICPWGSEGVYYLDMSGSTAHHIPTARLDRVVESSGAGDSFIGAALAGLSRSNAPLHVVLQIACDVATLKCSQRGFELPLSNVSEWRNVLETTGDSDDPDGRWTPKGSIRYC